MLNGVIVATESENVLSSEDVDLSMLEACNHEEADIRIFLHAKQAVQAGHRKILSGQSTPMLLLLLFHSSVHYKSTSYG